MKQLVSALIDLHSRRIFHRDIKLNNILIQTLPDGLRVRIIDFGCGCTVMSIPYESYSGTISVFTFHCSPAHGSDVMYIFCFRHPVLCTPWAVLKAQVQWHHDLCVAAWCLNIRTPRELHQQGVLNDWMDHRKPATHQTRVRWYNQANYYKSNEMTIKRHKILLLPKIMLSLK